MWYYLSHLALKKVCEWISENFRRLFCLLTLVQLKEEFTFCCCLFVVKPELSTPWNLKCFYVSTS